jgi:phosphatidylserine decarboxylase
LPPPLNNPSDVPGPRPWSGRIADLLGIAAEGVPYTAIAAATGVLLFLLHYDSLAFLLIILAIAIGSFFRDPERMTLAATGAIISAADGKVTSISDVPLPGSAELFHRVAIFMSPLNAHVNRAPITGRVLAVTHTRGDFRAAFRDDANEHNERNLIIFEDAAGRRFATMQIAGYLARRIVCRLQPGDSVLRGQRIGMIMFGSRVDHYFPLDYRVTAILGSQVRAGDSPLADLPPPDPTPPA